MAHSLAGGLKGLSAPGKASVKPTPKGNASIGAIEPLVPTKPKSFTDKNLDLGYGVGGANGFSTKNAKPGGSIKPQLNATPKMGAANVRTVSKA